MCVARSIRMLILDFKFLVSVGHSRFLGESSARFCSTTLASFQSLHHVKQQRESDGVGQAWRHFFFFARSWESRTSTGFRLMLD